MCSPTSKKEEQTIIPHEGFIMKISIRDRDKFKEKYKNIFIRKNKTIKVSRWFFYQILFKLWVVHARLTRRDFTPTKNSLESAIKNVKLSGNLIDIGGGSGWMSEYWDGEGLYVVVDPMFRKVIIKYQAYKKNKLVFVQSKAEKIPFEDNTFNCALICAAIDHVENPDIVLSETSRVLRNNGHLFVTHKIDTKDRRSNLGHQTSISENKLKSLLKKEFRIERESKSPDKKIIYIWLKKIGA